MTQGRLSPPLAPEDDWFDEPEWFPEPDVPSSAGREVSHEPRTSDAEPVGSSRRAPDRRIIAAVVIGALVLLVGGILAARALTEADGASETTTATPPTSTTTTITTTPDPTTPTTTTTDTTDTTTQPEDASLRPGDESESVRQLQEDLVALGYSTGGVDGKYGPATERAVREFQTSSDLVVDGVAGPATLSALAQALDG
jgi:Putative peptidoglycan binding domain